MICLFLILGLDALFSSHFNFHLLRIPGVIRVHFAFNIPLNTFMFIVLSIDTLHRNCLLNTSTSGRWVIRCAQLFVLFG